MPRLPLLEVFGFPVGDNSDEAARYRANRLCPFNNKVPNCTKDKANDPLGVCTIHDGDGGAAITCPVRFRESWIIAEDAATFFFDPAATWTSLVEVRLKDAHGTSAGNIDVVLVEYDQGGRVTDFGACEVQAVYISGNVRDPFRHYMEDPARRAHENWDGPHYPRPDYLSSSRKRLAPQLLFKGGILSAWGKKQAVVIHSGFFDTLPPFERVEREEADLVWLVYDLVPNLDGRLQLHRHDTVYTRFHPTMLKVTTADPGRVDEFVSHLQAKLDEKLDSSPPSVHTILESELVDPE